MNYKTNIKEIIGMGMISNLLINKYRPHFFCGLFGIFNVKFDKSIIIDFIKYKLEAIFNNKDFQYSYYQLLYYYF